MSNDRPLLVAKDATNPCTGRLEPTSAQRQVGSCLSGKTLLRVLLVSATFFASWPLTLSNNRAGISGRFAVADLATLPLMAVAGLLLAQGSATLTRPPAARSALVYLFVLTMVSLLHGIGSATVPILLELLILAYLISFFIVMYSFTRTPRQWKCAFWGWVLGMVLSCLIAPVDQLLGGIFFPQRSLSFQGTFRNGGQMGAYLAVTISLVLAYTESGVGSPWQRRFLRLCVLLGMLITFFTSKRAAIAALGVGLTAYVIIALVGGRVRQLSRTLLLGLAVGSMAAGTLWLLPEGADYYVTRLNALNPTESFQHSKWIRRHADASIAGFLQHPFLGQGIGVQIGDSFGAPAEIHSTYLRVANEAGVLGILAYLAFMGSILCELLRMRSNTTPSVRSFLCTLLPMFLGLLAMWAYNYHLRKREFWLLLALAFNFPAVASWDTLRRGLPNHVPTPQCPRPRSLRTDLPHASGR